MLVSGCMPSADDIYQYAEKTYGEAECVSQETSETGIKYNFVDSEYGFEYSIICMNNDASRPSDFRNAYMSYADSKLMGEYDRIQKDYNITMYLPERSMDYSCFCSIVAETEESGIDAAKELAAAYESYDTRKWWQNKGMTIEIISSIQVRYGTLFYDGLKYISKEESDLMFYTNYVHQNVDNEAVFKEKALFKVEDFATLFDYDILTEDGWDIGSAVTIYYFTSKKGTDIFIADAYYNGNPCVFVQ